MFARIVVKMLVQVALNHVKDVEEAVKVLVKVDTEEKYIQILVDVVQHARLNVVVTAPILAEIYVRMVVVVLVKELVKLHVREHVMAHRKVRQ